MRPTVSLRAIWIAGGLALAALAIALGVRFLATRQGPGGATAPALEQAKPRYHCPMHPTMVSDRPGDCPICSMRLVQIEQEPPSPPAGDAASSAATRRKVIYRSTMNPAEVSDRPGKDSMGMEMVPVEVEEEERPGAATLEGRAPVRIPTRKQQLIGVRTSTVQRAPMVRSIRAVGRVTADETLLHRVHTKIGGWVETLQVNATGEKVRRGQPLLTIYSPELLATQEEYLLALRTYPAGGGGALPEVARGGEELIASARRRLLLYDLTPAQIEDLEKTAEPTRTMTLFSPISGYVLKRNVTQGQKIDSDTNLLDIADLSRVWVLASIYEYELPFIKVGQAALMSLSYLPGKIYRGRVSLVYPVLEEATRTVQVRLEFENPGLALKPEMYADVRLQSDLGERLTIPETAVLWTGTRSLVFVAQGEGYFEPREVRIGLRLPDAVEVLEGLAEGDRVVTSGNFFIDSESKLKAALEAIAAPRPSEPR